MKALFCHDHYYYKDAETILSKGQYSIDLWKRYLQYFDTLNIIGRDGGAANKNESGINICSTSAVDFHLFQNTNSLKGLLSGRKTIKDAIADLVSSHDIIILRGISELGTMAFHEAKRQGKYIVMEVVSCAWDELWYHGSIKAKIFAFYRFYKQRAITREANAAIYVSKQFLQQRYPRNRGLTAAVSDVALSKEAFRKKDNTPQPPFKIGLIGTLKNKLKGVDVAIEAMHILKQQGHEAITLHILGPGNPAPYTDKINQLGLQNHVRLDGILQSGQPVLDWLYDKDLYIQPSFQEGLPRAVVEAMSQSLPVIGSDAGGIPELIGHQWIVRRGDAKRLAQKITDMISTPKIMQDQGDQNSQTAMQYRQQILDQERDAFWLSVQKELLR